MPAVDERIRRRPKGVFGSGGGANISAMLVVVVVGFVVGWF